MPLDTPFPPRKINNITSHAMNPANLQNPCGGLDMPSSGAGNIPITLEEFLKVGSTVKATTLHGVVHQGEIMAVDNKTRLVFLAVPTKSADQGNNHNSNSNNSGTGGTRHNIVMINLNMLKKLDTVTDNNSSTSGGDLKQKSGGGGPHVNGITAQLQSCRVEDAELRFRQTLSDKMKRVDAIGIGVSPEAQLLFDKLSKQYKQCSWNGTSIVVGDLNVTVSPPYCSNDCVCVNGEKESSVKHVKQLVDNIWVNQVMPKQQQSTLKKQPTSSTNGGGGGGGTR